MHAFSRPGNSRIAREIYDREMALVDPEVRASRTRVEGLLHPDFIETGSSGEIYGRLEMVEMLAREKPGQVMVRDYDVEVLSDEVALAHYRSVGAAGQEVRRTSVWVRTGDTWRLRHHQGTKVPDRWGPVF